MNTNDNNGDLSLNNISQPEEFVRSSTANSPKRSLNIVRYNADSFHRQEYTNKLPDAISPPSDSTELMWLRAIGINNADSLHNLLKPFGIHDLVIEDILSRRQRAKIEDYGDYLFMVFQTFEYQNKKLQSDQIYIIMGQGFLLTFQQRPMGLFSTVRDNLQQNRLQSRNQGIDCLCYFLIDRLIDDYFSVINQFSNRTEHLDKTLFKSDSDDVLLAIHKLKREAMRLRRSLLPQREMLNQLVRGDFAAFNTNTRVYLRDVHDHSIQLLETVDTARDSVVSMMDVHLSYQSNRLNKQMRVLTVITILFMPLTVITGIYGMNFDNMPELHWHYGYFLILAVMASVVVSLLTYFSRNKWL
ncbi:magnesium/cobalt transporter CorA [Stenoxybacter acetivorans]|uniref:magnesium/cobalt transporter CorA n=1 Tax=Stenoxybacter acetivorans TaxID=422441 RepID=UPI00056A62B8|nr:magnesium/cobalt transporter CorA [Stenoxybacter acetivorans]